MRDRGRLRNSLYPPEWVRTSSHPILRYGNRVAFSIYLFHQPLIVIIAFFVVPLSLAISAKFVLITLASLVFSVCLHEGLMRR